MEDITSTIISLLMILVVKCDLDRFLTGSCLSFSHSAGSSGCCTCTGVSSSHSLTSHDGSHCRWQQEQVCSYLCHLSLNSAGLQSADGFLSSSRVVKVHEAIAWEKDKHNIRLNTQHTEKNGEVLIRTNKRTTVAGWN